MKGADSMWRVQRRSMVMALATVLALAGCTSGGEDAVLPSPPVSPTGDQSPSMDSDAEEVTWTLEAKESPLVLEDDVEGVAYDFWLNGAEEFTPGPELFVGDFTHQIRWSDVSSFTVDLADVPAARDECHKTALRYNPSDEVQFQESPGGRGSVDVSGEPFHIFVVDCPGAVVTVS